MEIRSAITASSLGVGAGGVVGTEGEGVVPAVVDVSAESFWLGEVGGCALVEELELKGSGVVGMPVPVPAPVPAENEGVVGVEGEALVCGLVASLAAAGSLPAPSLAEASELVSAAEVVSPEGEEGVLEEEVEILISELIAGLTRCRQAI